MAATGSVGATPVSDDATIQVQDNVRMWERAVLPLRTSDDAPTAVTAPRTFVNIESASTGDVPLNRRTLTIHEKDRELNLSFESTTGAGTTNLAGDEAQLLAVRLSKRPNVSGVGDGTVRNQLTDVFNNNTDAVSVELLDDAEGVDTFDSNGELSASFTPEHGGTYGFVLVTVDDGSGLSVQDDAVEVDGNVTIVGIEQALVQEGPSSVEAQGNRHNPGDAVQLDVETGHENESVTHAVVLYSQGELARQSSTVTVSGNINETISADQVSIESSTDQVRGTSSVEVDTRIVGIDPTDDESLPAVGLPGLFDLILTEAADTEVSDDENVLHASGTVVTDEPETTLTVETLDDWPNGAYRFVHVAVGNESGHLYSDTGTVSLSQAGGASGDGGNDDDSNGDDGDSDDDDGDQEEGEDDEEEEDNGDEEDENEGEGEDEEGENEGEDDEDETPGGGAEAPDDGTDTEDDEDDGAVETTASSGPGFGVIVAMLAFLVTAMLARRRE